MALAKLPRGKIKSYNDYGQDFFIFSFFSLHHSKLGRGVYTLKNLNNFAHLHL